MVEAGIKIQCLFLLFMIYEIFFGLMLLLL
jgi:hypothetical protein